MPIPGFTAESSIGPTTQVYRVQDRPGGAAAVPVLLPQWSGGHPGLAWEHAFGDSAAGLAPVEAEPETGEDAGDEAAVDATDEGVGDDEIQVDVEA